jgi:hypothetical protein
LFNIYIDQVLTGYESEYLTQDQINDGIAKFLEDKRSSKDLYEKIRINIWDSLHYQYLLNPSKYSEIYEDFLINSGQAEHSLEKFRILLNSFDEINLSVNPIKYEKFANVIQVLDGVHRLAIYYFKTHKKTISKTYFDNMKATTISLDGARNKFILNWILKLSRGSIFSNAWAKLVRVDCLSIFPSVIIRPTFRIISCAASRLSVTAAL